MDDPNIQLLQMACVTWGGGDVTLIFFRVVISLACAAHWSMKSKIFMFLPLSGNPIEQGTPQKWIMSSMNLKLLCISWGVLLHF
jgi:hypothetical protein